MSNRRYLIGYVDCNLGNHIIGKAEELYDAENEADFFTTKKEAIDTARSELRTYSEDATVTLYEVVPVKVIKV